MKGRKEESEGKKKTNFILRKGLSVATSGSSTVIYNWLLKRRSAALDFLNHTYTPWLHHLPAQDYRCCPLHSLPAAEGHNIWWESPLFLRWGGTDKSLVTEKYDEKGIWGFEELWHQEKSDKRHRTVFFKHVDHQTLLGLWYKYIFQPSSPKSLKSASVRVGWVGLHNFLTSFQVIFMIEQIWEIMYWKSLKVHQL